jgi:hypothetical protein
LPQIVEYICHGGAIGTLPYWDMLLPRCDKDGTFLAECRLICGRFSGL